MGFMSLLVLWPILLVAGLFVLILHYIPYIMLIYGVFWLVIGLLAKYLFNKYQLFKKGKSHKKAWMRIITEIARWAISIDIIANSALIIVAIILCILFV